MGGSLSRVKERFANRFEADGDGYVFRATLSAAGYRVSATQRDRMVSEFDCRITWLTWGGSALIIVLFIAVAWPFIASSMDVPTPVFWAIMALGLGLYLVPFYWLWNAPARVLRSDAPFVVPRSKAEARLVGLQRLTWGQLGLAVLMTGLMLWRVSLSANLLVGWNRLWLVFAGAMMLLVAVQGLRKLRANRQD